METNAMNQTYILIVEDDTDINNLLAKILTKAGFATAQAFSGTEAKLLLSMGEFDLIMLDLMLPGITGEELIPSIREKSQMPILVLSAKTALEDKVNVLNIGADDYLTKPFEKEEVLARVHAALRRYTRFLPKQENELVIYKYKMLSLDTESREVKFGDNPLSLTGHEYDILLLLMQNPNKVYSRESLYEAVWQGGYYGEDNTVNVHVSNLRKKIAQFEQQEEYIKTVWGIGFKLA